MAADAWLQTQAAACASIATSKKARSSMTRSAGPTLVVLFAMSLLLPAQAQTVAQPTLVAGRGQGGTINYAPRPGLYSVVLVDARGRMVRMRDLDGKTADVHVAEGVYDLSKLKIGDKIRVEFLAMDAPDKKPRAATIWPAK
jgi:hypothetical protein